MSIIVIFKGLASLETITEVAIKNQIIQLDTKTAT